MKAIGYIRYLDRFGRIVLPHVVRAGYNLESGDNIEFSLADDNIIRLSRVSPFEDIAEILDEYLNNVYDIMGLSMCISDRYGIKAAVGPDCAIIAGKALSAEARAAINSRAFLSVNCDCPEYVHLLLEERTSLYEAYVLAPIVSGSDTTGAVIVFLPAADAGERLIAEKTAKVAAAFIGKMIDQN